MVKLAATVLATAVALIVLVAAATAGVVSALFGAANTTSQPSQAAQSDIPGDYLILYQQASSVCPGLDWTVLAGIGKIETDHGRSNLPGVRSGSNSAGAAGPMQFIQSTFDSVVARHHIPAGGNTPPSRYNPHDAIYVAAFYLCDSGARDNRDLYGAVFTYNQSDSYVSQVLNQAAKYKAADASGVDQAPPPQAQQAITFAQEQVGRPGMVGKFDVQAMLRKNRRAAWVCGLRPDTCRCHPCRRLAITYE